MAEPRHLYRADVAELLGIRPDSLQRLKLPAPDGVDVDRGHARPWWTAATIREWQARRPGRGRRWADSHAG